MRGERLSPAEMADGITAAGGRAAFVPDVPAIVAHVAAAARSGDVVAILSNGGFGGIHELLLAALRP